RPGGEKLACPPRYMTRPSSSISADRRGRDRSSGGRALTVFHRLHELDEGAARRPGGAEGKLVAARAGAGRFVNQLHANALQERQRLLDALDLDGDVVKPRTALLEELHEPVVAARRDELDVPVSNRQERCLGLLRGDGLTPGGVEAEDLLVF